MLHPMGGIGRVFALITKEAEIFKDTYAKKMHKSIRIYMNEKALEKIEPVMQQVVENLVADGAKPIMPAKDAAKFLTHALGSLIIKSDTKWLEDNRFYIRAAVNRIMGLSEEEAKQMNDLSAKESWNKKF